MKLTIIPADGSVGEDGKFYNDLNLSSCGIPADVHALQWENVAGWIEFKDPVPNQPITELPAWANCCMTKEMVRIHVRCVHSHFFLQMPSLIRERVGHLLIRPFQVP